VFLHHSILCGVQDFTVLYFHSVQRKSYGAARGDFTSNKPENDGRRKNVKCHDDRPDPET